MTRNVRPGGIVPSHPGADSSNEMVSAPARVPNEATAKRRRMARWREALFRLLLRVDARSASFYGIPREQLRDVDLPIER